MRFELAPMEGVTDFPTRVWLSLCGAFSAATTPFLRVTRDYPAKRIPSMFAPELTFTQGETCYELAPQVMGSDADDVARLVEGFLARGARHVDFNCGCPAPTVFAHRAGSRLLECPESYARFLERLAERVGAERMSIKIRLGIRDPDAEAPALFEALAERPWKRVAIHGRTREQRYKGAARWDLIAAGARHLAGRVPVCGSGDVRSAESLGAVLAQAPEVASIMVGRGALRNPWLLGSFKNLWVGNETPGSETPSAREGSPLAGAEIGLEALLLALEAYARMQEAFELRPEELLRMAHEGVFAFPCGTEAQRWEALCGSLAGDAREAPESLTLQRGSLAKVKMLWNYLRSGLPAAFFDPAPLRAASFGAFHAAVAYCGSQGGGRLRLTHDPARDWIYSGEKADASVPIADALRPVGR